MSKDLLNQAVSDTPLPSLSDLDLSPPTLTAKDVLPDPTPEQADFMSAMKGADSIQLRAVAGSGKTTALKAGSLMTARGAPALATAYNKPICEELTTALPKWFTVQGLNSLGHGAWARTLGGKRLSLNKDKCYEIINARWEWEDQQDFPELKKLVDLARNMGIVPAGSKGLSKGLNDDEESWRDLIENYEVEYPAGEEAELIDRAREVVRSCIERSWSGQIDFVDQLYMPSIFNAPFKRYPLVLVDEAQDLSEIQHTMLAKSLSTGGRVVAVGDPHQAIYGFRGAHANSMEALRRKFNARVMPLTVSFRCPQAVVAVAQRFVPEIRAFHKAPEGVVGESDISQVRPHDTVLCRYNKPLFQLAFKLIKKGLGPKILGRDIGAGLVRIVRKFGSVTVGELTGPLLNWSAGQMEMLRARRKESQAQLVADKTECIMVVAEQLGSRATTDQLIDAIQRLFDDRGGLVTLATIHKAKGLEWPRVHFLGFDQLPPRWVEEGGWQYQQEINAIYIGVTRAKKELYFLSEKA